MLTVSMSTSEVMVRYKVAAPLLPGVGPPAASGMTRPTGATSANPGLFRAMVMGVPREED